MTARRESALLDVVFDWLVAVAVAVAVAGAVAGVSDEVPGSRRSREVTDGDR
jgi:hypothetical protein